MAAVQRDTINMTLRDIPILGGALAVAGDLMLAGGDVILSGLATILLSVGEIVPILSLIAGTIAPRVDWIPTGLFDQLLLTAAVLLVGIQIARLLS